MAQSSESITSIIMKSPFHTWHLRLNSPNEPPLSTYDPANKSWITLRISHVGNLIDSPGRPFKKANVSYLEDVDVNDFNLSEYKKIETHFGYKTLGKWYCVNDDPDADTDFLPLHTEGHVASFVEREKRNNLQHIEQIYAEHDDPEEIVYLPKPITESTVKRVQKLVYVFLKENSKATIDEAIGFVLQMIGVVVPVSKMEKLVRQATFNLSFWRFSRVGS